MLRLPSYTGRSIPEMANVTRYKTSKGETRYRVRYRKPDGTQTDKRGFRRKIDAENWAAEHVTIAKATDMFVDPQAGNRLIGELHDEWLAERKPFWKPSHIGREQCLCQRTRLASFRDRGHRRIRDTGRHLP